MNDPVKTQGVKLENKESPDNDLLQKDSFSALPNRDLKSDRVDSFGNSINRKEKCHKIMFNEHMVHTTIVENWKKFNVLPENKKCKCHCSLI